MRRGDSESEKLSGRGSRQGDNIVLVDTSASLSLAFFGVTTLPHSKLGLAGGGEANVHTVETRFEDVVSDSWEEVRICSTEERTIFRQLRSIIAARIEVSTSTLTETRSSKPSEKEVRLVIVPGTSSETSVWPTGASKAT